MAADAPAASSDIPAASRPQRGVVAVEERDDAAVVRLRGELDLYNVHEVRSALELAISRSPERLVVDLEAVTFMDSTALAVLVYARSRLSNRRAFLLASARTETMRVLQMAGLTNWFGLYASIDDALAARL